jgi:hypothetical protein
MMWNKQVDALAQSVISQNSRTVLFCKTLYLFVLFKLWISWPVIELVAANIPVKAKSWLGVFLFAPNQLWAINPIFFVVFFSSILIISIFIRLNYISAFLIFWFSVCLSKFLFPILSGADLVLNLLLVLGVSLPVFPVIRWKGLEDYQQLLSAFGVLLIKVQIGLIYFLSGYDKLLTDSWRNGEAIFSVLNLDFFSNPNLLLELTKGAALVTAWLVILFEISFPIFIWFNKVRKYWLITGIVFHLAIIIFMGLLDFGLVMIISYLIFVPAKERST